METGKTFIISFAVLIFFLVGGWLGWTYLKENNERLDKAIVLNGAAQKETSVSLTDMYPGCEKAYEIQFEGEQGKKYYLAFSFEEKGDVTLAEFVDVQIKYGGKIHATRKLSEFLQGANASMTVAFSSSSKTSVEIVYSMSESVGDEAQGAVADFTLIIAETPALI